MPERLLRVPSFREALSYEVVTRGETTTCDCPAFMFNKSRPKMCKHVRVAVAVYRAEARCVERHDTEPGLVCVQCVAELMSGVGRRLATGYRKKKEKQKKKEKT